MARTAPKAKVAPEPEINLTELLEKDPSEVNVAEAAWLVECTKLDLDMDPMELVERGVQLVAGKAHRAWQNSATNEELHAEIAERREATAAEKAEARAEREKERAAAAAEREANPSKRRGRSKATSLADEDGGEEEAPAPKPRRGRPAKVAAPVDEEEEAPAPRKPAARRRARSGAESPF